PPRPPQRPASPRDAAGGERSDRRARVRGPVRDLWPSLRAGARRGLLRGLPRLRPDALLPAPLPSARADRADTAGAPHAPSLPGRDVRLRYLGAVLGRRLPYVLAHARLPQIAGSPSADSR